MSVGKNKSLRAFIHEVIFEADTRLGRRFDVFLLILILVSVLMVILESVDFFDQKYHQFFMITEWVLTIIFTIEYFLRLWVVNKPLKYVTSFFGIVDLLSIIPTYLSLFIAGSHYLLVIRILRLLRVFRIFKLVRFLGATAILNQALKASRPKIVVFLTTVLLIVVVIGSMMYLVEGNANSGFDNIPVSIYWAIVTLTTVGYGDITPITPLGRVLSAMIMIMGYGIIAVPTGIVTAELANVNNRLKTNTQNCQNCGFDDHDDDAKFCKSCGYDLKV